MYSHYMLTQVVSFTDEPLLQPSPFKVGIKAGDTQKGFATLSQIHHQDIAHSRCWEWAGWAERWISTLIIQCWVEGLMASTQTGRQAGRLAGRYEDEWPVRFPAESLFVSWMCRSRGRRAVFRPTGSLKINRRIHRGLSFLSLRLNEVVCAWCVRRGERVSGVMLHFNEVLLAPRSCHYDLTVTYKLMWMQAWRHAGTDGEQGMKKRSLRAQWKHFDVE